MLLYFTHVKDLRGGFGMDTCRLLQVQSQLLEFSSMPLPQLLYLYIRDIIEMSQCIVPGNHEALEFLSVLRFHFLPLNPC
jgi:hypothetical protein